MQRNYVEKTILNAVTPVAVTSSTDATPIVVTATTHGLVTGQRVLIQGHTTNIAANGIFKVTNLTANTFSLQDEFTGADVAGTGAGAGSSGIALLAPDVVYAKDFKVLKLTITTGGAATITAKVTGSDGKLTEDSTTPRYDFPNFGATVSKTNPYSLVQVVNYDDGSAVSGSTGIAVTGTDISRMYEANTNGIKYITVLPVTWTQGSITVKALCEYI